MPGEQRFGGEWTDRKLGILQKYLGFFTTALSKKQFELIYIDGFAGSGGRIIERIISRELPLFGDPLQSEQIHAPGSARIALETTPPFHRIVMIERHGRRFLALQALCALYPKIKAQLLRGEANTAITELCRSTDWHRAKGGHRGVRAVLFLDPYGMNVAFETLKEIAATQAIDVWYLFPLSGVYRQAARARHRLTPDKEASITRILGTDGWKTEFYKRSDDLFGAVQDSDRTANVDAIENYVRERLSSLFPSVAAPLRLHTSDGAPLFSLFFAVSNREPRAIGLARKCADHILKAGISSQVRPRN